MGAVSGVKLWPVSNGRSSYETQRGFFDLSLETQIMILMLIVEEDAPAS